MREIVMEPNKILSYKKFYLICFGIILLVSACSDILQEKPKSSLSTAAFYQTKQDAVSAINDVYARLTKFPHDELSPGIVLSDQAVTEDFGNATLDALVLYEFTPANDIITDLWVGNYDVINKANNVIKKVPNIDMDASLSSRIIGEAHFLRGLSYFNLVKAFGAVPLVLNPTTGPGNLNVSRTSEDSVYAQIFTDLKSSADVLPLEYGASDVGRATKGAAQSILAKAYLFHEDWQKAAAEAKKVIDSNQYSLFSDYADKWKLENENEKEFIFSIQYTTEIGGAELTFETMPRSSGIAPKNFGTFLPTSYFYNSFDSTDYRKEVTFKTSYTFPDGRVITFSPHCWKYFSTGQSGETGVNTPVIAYDDVLLIYAEAVNEDQGPVKDAYDAINKIRERAHLNDLTSGLSQDQFRKAVWQERNWELAFEGHRTWDLMRTGQLVEALKASGTTNVNKKNLKLPIPQREIDINPNLKQNEGW